MRLVGFWKNAGVASIIHLSQGNRIAKGRKTMSSSVYKIIEVVGTSNASWEAAAKNAVEIAGQSLHDLRIAEVEQLDMKITDGKVVAFRARVKISFKYKDRPPLV